MNKRFLGLPVLAAAIVMTSYGAMAQKMVSLRADINNAGLKLAAGFGSIVVAKDPGRARHLAVNTNGDVYIKLEKLKDGKGIFKLTDTNVQIW